MKNFVILLLLAFTIGCEQYPNTFKACVNYLEPGDQYCGTGFFIDFDTVVTAAHIIDESEDNILTAVGPGENETFYDFDRIDNEVDVIVAKGQHDITTDICPICPDVKTNSEVIILGNPTRFKSPEIRTGILRATSSLKKHLYIEGEAPEGFSGGPIIETERNCVIGSVIGQWLQKDGWTKAANLTELLKDE